MDASPAMMVFRELTALGVELAVAGDKLRYSPRAAMTPALADRLKSCKSELLKFLREPVVASDRYQLWDDLTDRLNAVCVEGMQIDWQQLDALQQRIDGASTTAELGTAIVKYEQAALAMFDQPMDDRLHEVEHGKRPA